MVKVNDVVILENKFQEETLQILLDSYKDKSTSVYWAIPPVEGIYHLFLERWLDEMTADMFANPSGYGVEPDEFNRKDIFEVMEIAGLPAPSFDMIVGALNDLGMSYITKEGHLVNGAVVQVW